MSPRHLDEDVYNQTIRGFSGLAFILSCLLWEKEENDYNLGILKEGAVISNTFTNHQAHDDSS